MPLLLMSVTRADNCDDEAIEEGWCWYKVCNNFSSTFCNLATVARVKHMIIGLIKNNILGGESNDYFSFIDQKVTWLNADKT